MVDEQLRLLERKKDESLPDLLRYLATAARAPKSKKPAWRAMSELEVKAAKAICSASFSPGTGAKRIARRIAGQVLERRITAKQAVALWRIAWAYRRSIADEEVLAVAEAFHEACP